MKKYPGGGTYRWGDIRCNSTMDIEMKKTDVSIHLRDYTVLLFPPRNNTITLRIWFVPNFTGTVNGKFSSGYITGFFVNMVLFHVLSYHHLYKSGIMGIAKHTIRGNAEKVFTGSYIRYIYADMGFIRFARLYDVR